MFAWTLCFTATLAVIVVLALGVPGRSSSASAETRYVVRTGDTLWAIAVARYDGDPREAVWRIKARNALGTSALVPGMVLALPAA